MQNIPLGNAAAEIPPGLPRLPPVQQPPPANAPRGYVRMAVMDGKMVGHRVSNQAYSLICYHTHILINKICAVDDCKKLLVNYKNGRFCEQHLELLGDLCGIIPCGQPRRSQDALTCDDPDHIAWYKAWSGRFKRLSYPSVRRVIREQRANPINNQPFRLELPELAGLPGEEVTHTFRARTVYCLETIQWACGMPVGWGKCYRSESAPQVLQILKRVWEGHEGLRPSFLCYDDACDLLRHIVTQDANDPWLKSTKFVVDAFHYINHRATDILCRLWCNPAPTNGSQPDLVQVERDANGRTHQTRAFNTETAEQLNAWLNGYDAPLRNMTDVNFDFFVHSLFLLFAENIEARIERKNHALPVDFWEVGGGA